MTGPADRRGTVVDRLGGECPQCGEPIEAAHARAAQVVLVPCGHSIDAMSALSVPPEERNGHPDGP